MTKIHSLDFDMDQIANSGQCFRISKIAPETWQVIAWDKTLQIHQEEDHDYVFECSREEYHGIWFDYFDMQRDYGEIKKRIRATNDPYLIAAIDYGYGIRILKQDPWEATVTFLISQQNNIPRIRNIIAKLCEPYGNQFPTPNLLAKYTEDDFLSLGLGYRAKYLQDISKVVLKGDLDFNKLKCMNCSEVVNFLKQFNGIGNKVANCIALFGLHKIEAFPIDVWIKRIIDDQYGGNFDTNRFPGYAGIVQQYMFFYQRDAGSTHGRFMKF
ncbi:8-oxoguanine DNA glycosylase [Alphaproteobacteria bacterium]|nr:8-oxoguanine DNA glycosylase [Alphaproteobacteria bacterium]